MPILEQTSVQHLFHAPRINNNYFVYLRRDIDAADYSAALSQLYVKLNQADLKLKEWFTTVNESIRIEAVEKLLEQWGVQLEKRLNLSGVFYVKEIVQQFAENRIDVVSRVRSECPHLVRNFIDVPQDLLGVWRLNLCIPYPSLLPVLETLVGDLSVSEEAFSVIDRIEILKNAPADAVVSYPTLIVYLNRRALSDRKCTDAFFARVKEFVRMHGERGEMTHTFADPLAPFANLTQGFKLHKVYLSLLQVLDDVYDNKLNYAYLVSNAEERQYVRDLGSRRVEDVLNEIG